MHPAAARRAQPHGRHWAFVAALLLLLFIVYVPAIRGGFIWDDDKYVSHNPHLRTASGLIQIWTRLGATPQYYPLAFTTFWAEYHLWGLNPAGYHVINVLCHGATALLLWRVLTRLSVPGAAFAAAVFALHPVHVESVAWITERKNVLSGLLYMGSLLAYCRFADLGRPDNPESRAWPWYGVSLLLFSLALLSKTVTCSLPAVILLILWWKRGRIPRIDLLALTPMLLIGLAMSQVTAHVESQFVGARGAEWNFTVVERCLVAGRALWFYLGKLLWPINLTFIYPRWEIDADNPSAYVFPLAAVCLIVALWAVRHRIGKGPLVAALFFGGTLTPALGFVNVYPMRFSFVADHFQYLASIGLIVLFAGVVTRFIGSVQNRASSAIRTAIVGVILTCLALLTRHQANIYENLETLYGDTLRKNPGAWMAHNNLAGHLLQKTQAADLSQIEKEKTLHKAIHHAEQAINLRPQTAHAHRNLGIARAQQKRFAEAEQHLREAVRLDPDDAQAIINLGLVAYEQGQILEAIKRYQLALQVTPDSAATDHYLRTATDQWRKRCMKLANKGHEAQAIEELRAGLKACPTDADAHYALGVLLLRRGLRGEGEAALREAVRLIPSHVRARQALEAVPQGKHP